MRNIKSVTPVHPLLRPVFYATTALFVWGGANAYAQTGGGLAYSLGLTQRLSFESNPTLSPTSSGSASISTTELFFTVTSETATDRLSLRGGTSFRLSEGAGSDGFDLGNRGLDLGYQRQGLDTSLDFSASTNYLDIEFPRPITDFFDEETGTFDVPEDQAELTGTGTQRAASIGGEVTFGAQSPVGLKLGGEIAHTDYFKTTAPNLINSQRRNFNSELRIDLSPVTSATAAYSLSDVASRDLVGRPAQKQFQLGLNRAFSTGQIGVFYGHQTSPQIRNNSLNGSYDITSLTQNFGATLGISKNEISGENTLTGALRAGSDFGNGRTTAQLDRLVSSTGAAAITGALNIQHNVQAGNVNLQLSRSLSTRSTDDLNQFVNLIGVNYLHNLDPNTALRIEAAFVDTQIQNDDVNMNQNLSASLGMSRALPQNWSVNASLTHVERRTRSALGRSTARSNVLSFSLGKIWLR